MIVSLIWAAAAGQKPDWSPAASPVTKALAFYCAVAVVVSVTALVPRVSFGQFNKDAHKLCLTALLLVALRRADQKHVPRALAAGAIAAALYGIGQSVFLRRSDGVSWERAQGFTHPLAYGEFMGLLWLGAVCARLRGGFEARTNRLLEAGVAVLGAALVLSQARGAFLGVAVGVFVIGLADRRLRKLAVAAAVGVPLVFLAWELMPGDHNLRTAFSSHYMEKAVNPFFARLTFWKIGWDAFLEHPWLGVGPGNYRIVFSQVWSQLIEGQRVWGSAHNLYIHQAAERGLLGLAALAGVLWTLTARAYVRARKSADVRNLWSLAACAAFLAMNLTEVAWQTEQVTSLFLFIWCYAEVRA
jgi:O-antigen ligase